MKRKIINNSLMILSLILLVIVLQSNNYMSLFQVKNEIKNSFKISADSAIIWQKNFPLKWEDYRMKPPKSPHFDALTTSGVLFKIDSQTKDFVVVSTYNYFYKYQSWTTKNSPELLQHEQLHFDITEVQARKLRKVLENYSIHNFQAAQKFLNDSYSRLIQEGVAMQNRYDMETQHGRNLVEQAKWEKKIHADLETYKAFSNPILKIKKGTIRP